MPDTPLNPDALAAAERWMQEKSATFGLHWKNAKPIIEAYLAVAQPEVNTVEELDQLPGGSIVKSGGREFYKTSYVELPWILPYGVDRFGSSYLAKHSKVIVIHRPEVKP